MDRLPELTTKATENKEYENILIVKNSITGGEGSGQNKGERD